MTEPKKNNFLMPNVTNKYQDIQALKESACSQVNVCDDCPYRGIEGDCSLMWEWIDNYAIQPKAGGGGGLLIEYRIRQMQIKNAGAKKLKEVKLEEDYVQCLHCKYQETITYSDGKLEETSKRKFAQVNGDIFHKCLDGLLRPCEKKGKKK